MGWLVEKRLYQNHQMRIQSQVAGIYSDSFESKPAWDIKIDTGFSGWIIFPSKAKEAIDPVFLENPSPLEFEQFKKKDVVILDTFMFLKIRLCGDYGQYSHEIAPDYVSFYDKPYGVLGMKLLHSLKSVLNVDAGTNTFSLQTN